MNSDATFNPNLGQTNARKAAKSKPSGTPAKVRTYRQYKRPAFVAAVLARHAAGESGRAIARELGVTRATVTRVLKQPGIEQKAQQTLENVQTQVLADFEKSVEEARTLLQAKIPDLMKMAINDTLEKRDRSLAHEMVKRAGVYPKEDKVRTNVLLQDNRLQMAIQQLVQQPRVKASAPFTVEAQAPAEPELSPMLEARESADVTSVTPVTPDASPSELSESTQREVDRLREIARRRF